MRNVTTAHRVIRNCAWLTVALSGACSPFPHRTTYPMLPVTAKEGISVLVSKNARCLVPTKVFPKVAIGSSYACNWRDGGVTIARMTAMKVSK